MTHFIKILFLALIISQISCKGRREMNYERDKAVMMEIFPSVIDSMYVEVVYSLRPPSGELVVDSVTGKKIMNPIVRALAHKNQIRKELMEGLNDATPVTVILDDTIHAFSESDKSDAPDEYVFPEYISRSGYKVDLDSGIKIPGLHIILSSNYNSRPHQRDRVLPMISFSRIAFNRDGDRGILTAEWGEYPVEGYRIYIRKVSGKWQIESIEDSWIS